MENLIFSLNATVPIFLTMILGFVFRKVGLMDEEFTNKANKFVFQAALPALLFSDLSQANFRDVWNGTFVAYCALTTIICIVISILISCLWKDKSIQGEFVQGAYRSSAAILGIAFIQNIYGNAGMAPLMIIGSVPLYNVMAVIVLSFFHPERKAIDKAVWMKTLKGIVTNPIIIGIVAGLIWSACKIPMPAILNKTVTSIGGMSTPMGLMAMGATFDFQKALGKIRPAVAATFMKLFVFVAIFLPVAVKLGFRREELIAILVMLGSATTVSSFVMSKNMGHEGTLSSSVVMLTTLFSAFTLTAWLYVLKAFQLV